MLFNKSKQSKKDNSKSQVKVDSCPKQDEMLLKEY